MKTIKKAKKEVVLAKYRVGQNLELGTHWHDGRGGYGTTWQPVIVVKDNEVTVDLLDETGIVVRFDKRGEVDYALKA